MLEFRCQIANDLIIFSKAFDTLGALASGFYVVVAQKRRGHPTKTRLAVSFLECISHSRPHILCRNRRRLRLSARCRHHHMIFHVVRLLRQCYARNKSYVQLINHLLQKNIRNMGMICLRSRSIWTNEGQNDRGFSSGNPITTYSLNCTPLEQQRQGGHG